MSKITYSIDLSEIYKKAVEMGATHIIHDSIVFDDINKTMEFQRWLNEYYKNLFSKQSTHGKV